MRKTMIASWILLAVGLTVSGCGGDGPARGDREAATATGEGKGHAPEGVEPGSREDWCEAHQVPETQCTQCNPALAAAFKATGDWCEEHGLPESHCRTCNPDLKIERPPGKEGA